MEINTLLETIRINNEKDQVEILDFDEHALRLFSSAQELKFHFAEGSKLKAQSSIAIDLSGQILRLKNLVKNEAQYYFKKPVVFTIEAESPRLKAQGYVAMSLQPSALSAYKLRILLHKDSTIDINIEPYTRDLESHWLVKLLDKEEFHIDSKEPKFKHKFYPRLDFSKYLKPQGIYDEVVWLNKKDEVCEGSFTNIFFQDADDNYHTPKLESNILPGIMRKKLIEKLNAQEKTIYNNEIKNFKKIFLSNSMIGLKEISI